MSNTCNCDERPGISDAEKVYENIFEAVHALDSLNPVCNGASKDGSLIRRQEFAPILRSDSFISVLEKRDSSLCLRGETALYPECKTSLYRISNEQKRIVEQVKAHDFMLFLLSLEDVRQWRENALHLDLLALAQHYGFATNMLDLTSDVVVAAFFATHYYDTRKLRYEVITSGVGRIRFIRMPVLADRVFPIGLQPFQRPGLQSGFGITLGEDEDFARMSESVCFAQDEMMNMRLSRAILSNNLMLPDEDIMTVATAIHGSPAVTHDAVAALVSMGDIRENDVLEALANSGVSIVDAPMVTADDYASLRRKPRMRTHRVAVMQPPRF